MPSRARVPAQDASGGRLHSNRAVRARQAAAATRRFDGEAHGRIETAQAIAQAPSIRRVAPRQSRSVQVHDAGQAPGSGGTPRPLRAYARALGWPRRAQTTTRRNLVMHPLRARQVAAHRQSARDRAPVVRRARNRQPDRRSNQRTAQAAPPLPCGRQAGQKRRPDPPAFRDRRRRPCKARHKPPRHCRRQEGCALEGREFQGFDPRHRSNRFASIHS